MKNMKTLKYCPQLNQITGSVTASLLLCQLEYWFKHTKGKTFYKFLGPCEDMHYRTGDSWTEELGFSKAEFRNAFNRIGKVYKSKKAYLESTDKFEGKLYLSYYDRMRKLTYYVRNHEALRQLIANQHCAFPYYKDYNPSPNPKEKSSIPYTEILSHFHKYCPSLDPVTLLTPKLEQKLHTLWTFLQQKGYDVFTTLDKAFQQVETSDFLCGRTGRSHWHAFFAWIIQPDKLLSILTGKYQNSSHPPTPSLIPKLRAALPLPLRAFHLTYEHDFDITALEARERAYQDAQFEHTLHNSPQKLL
ncbi:MAG: hypothetical protein RR090_12575 [Niameybacter sp.]|uniref:hypothetical protein n=1 Tax=Niameybacter sp. TaxID=2033640 RepID=UPI002FCB1E94